MGSIVGEKITRLLKYATKISIPSIIMCSSKKVHM
jgi:acetyl-CoA carboxylase beta subunit